MEISDLLKIGAKMFINSKQSGETGSALDMGSLTSALSGLAGGERGNTGLDLGSLLSKMDSGGLGDIAKSWLGDGDNQPVSPSQVTSLLGADKVSEFAAKLGLSSQEAAGGLSDALPHMVDQASSGGSLLDSIGGVSGVMGLAGKLFGK